MAVSTEPPRIPRESFAGAVDALLNWVQSQPKHQRAQLFEHDDLVYLIITLARIPSQSRTNPYRISIPHPLHPFNPESTSICLLLDDRTGSALAPSAALEAVRAQNLPIASVIGLSDLRSDYRPYESRRKLCDSYDLFFADKKIIPLLPRILGKHFFKRKKIPLPVDCSRRGWVEQIRSWCESSLLYLRTGTCAGLKIGRVNQDKDEIVDNAMAVIKGAMELVPKKWGNLRSVHVKTAESLALPVYQVVPGIGLKIDAGLDEKDGALVERKKRARGERKGKKERKAKKGRLHDGGLLVGGELSEGLEDVEEEEGFEVGEEGEEEDRLMAIEDGNNDDVEEGDVDLGETEVKKKMKKPNEKKGGKRKKVDGVDDIEEEEENADSQSGEKRVKKKKKKIEGDAMYLKGGDGEEEKVTAISTVKKMRKEKKVKKFVEAKEEKGAGDEDVGEGNVANELTGKSIKNKKKKVEKNVGLASDGGKKKPKSRRVNV